MGESFLSRSVALTLMAYELIRSIDAAHAHSTGTLANYSSHYNHLERFGIATGVTIPDLFPPPHEHQSLVEGADYYFAWHHVDLSMSGGRKDAHGMQLGRTFSTIRGHRSSIFHMYDEQNHPSPTNSPMFSAFMSGLRRRLGDESCPAWAISISVILAIQNHCSVEYDRLFWQALPGSQLWDDLWMTTFSAAWMVVAFCGGTRGNELFRVLLEHFLDPKHGCLGDPVVIRQIGHDYFCIPHPWDKTHSSAPCIIPIAAVTASGLQPKLWIKRCLELHARVGNFTGPFWRHRHNNKAWTSGYALNAILRPAVLRFATCDPPLVPAFVSDHNITSNSLRRGGNTRTGDVFVPRPLRDFLCRWRLPKGRQPVMQDRYDDPSILRLLQATLPI